MRDASPRATRALTLPILSDGSVDHAAAAARFNADEARTDWHDRALWAVRQKRDAAAAQVAEWEALRDLASRIKEHTLSHLDDYLMQFEAAARRNGAVVHWARDAAEHNAIVGDILRSAGATRVVKSKSMLTEECGLNPYLAARGVEVVDTDLGERIVQLRNESPSHIVMPAIHLTREDVGATFHEHLGTPAGDSDPDRLTAAARVHLRERFLGAQAAITGVNLAVAESGAFVVVTNEGNADLGMSIAPIHIACCGIEKLIPRAEDLGVFLRLLARSATGQTLSVYSSHVRAPRPGHALHIVLVDNGRSAQLGRPEFWRSLKCIRCAACLNTCPVYRRSGGHSYGSTVAGPIGSVLTPGFDLHKYAELPFASTLCGSCAAVCPVKVDLDRQLLHWRQRVTAAGLTSIRKRASATIGGWVLRSPRAYTALGNAARALLRLLGPARARAWSGAWGRGRGVPEPPAQSFRAWYATRATQRPRQPEDGANV